MKQVEVTDSLRNLVRERIQSSIQAKQALLSDPGFHDAVASVAMRIVQSLRAGGKIFFFGNGGSATDAEHLAAEFTGRYLRERSGLPAIALSGNLAAMTAIGND
ncbi:MAG: SIS domain-containing protein, partial [Bryobacteraceae bacterium]